MLNALHMASRHGALHAIIILLCLFITLAGAYLHIDGRERSSELSHAILLRDYRQPTCMPSPTTYMNTLLNSPHAHVYRTTNLHVWRRML
jgi:hypothetical protein